MNRRPIKEQVIILVYFVFSTVTTVGLGDFYPVSRNERTLTILLLLLSFIIFSVATESIKILYIANQEEKKLVAQEKQKFDKFLNVLRILNNGEKQRDRFINSMEYHLKVYRRNEFWTSKFFN